MLADTITARAQLPGFIVRTQTVYLVTGAPTAARVLQWFADTSDIELDVVSLDFGRVEVIGQVASDQEAENMHWATRKARRARVWPRPGHARLCRSRALGLA